MTEEFGSTIELRLIDEPADGAARADGTVGTDGLANAAPDGGAQTSPDVEVAVDAPGASQTYTYSVPARFGAIDAGEAVLVEFGRGRQALGVVLGPARVPEPAALPGPAAVAGRGAVPAAAEAVADHASTPGLATPEPVFRPKPILARVRADGPLLPPLTLEFARWISQEYLAPPAAVLRSMLPPGMLERLELVAEWLPTAVTEGEGEGEGGRAEGEAADGAGASGRPSRALFGGTGVDAAGRRRGATLVLGAQPVDASEERIRDRLANGPQSVADLDDGDGRAVLLRRLRGMAARGLVRLEWTLTAAAAGPRYERWLTLTESGRGVAAELAASAAAGLAPTGRLGPRQRALLEELAAAGKAGMSGAMAGERHGSGTATSLARRGLLQAEVRERPRRPLEQRRPGRRGTRPAGSDLTAPQAEAIAAITAAMSDHDATPLLLEGVTGSGKTAVYAEAVAETLAAGRAALILVPEIALAMPLVDRLRADLDAEIAMLHSGLSEGERADEWRRIRAGGTDIVVGTRVALTAPLADIGLIVVDEEHDAAYKSDRTPRLQARDAALALARISGAAVVLGSATPSVESVGRVRMGTYRHALLPDRPSGAPPRVVVVDLRAELAGGNRGLLSGALHAALAALPAGERAILVLNRRGTASVVLCRDCGYVQRCPECERSLVFHQAGVTLRCHHCGTASPLATRCPECRSPRIRYLGGGTQRVEEEVKAAFPDLRVGRLDRDVAEHKGAVQRVLDAFGEGRLDVLVGTSLVAKGLDIPEVTLVGVISADIALNLPDERAAERTFQLLTQAVGRAGRGGMPGLAIIQTYQPDHPAIRAVETGDAASFYDAELEVRRRFGSPPYGRLVKLTVGLPDQKAAEREASAMADRLRSAADAARPGPAAASVGGSNAAGTPAFSGSPISGSLAGVVSPLSVDVLGPAPAYIARRAGRWRWNVVLRGNRPLELLNPPPGAPWSIDVDPDSLL